MTKADPDEIERRKVRARVKRRARYEANHEKALAYQRDYAANQKANPEEVEAHREAMHAYYAIRNEMIRRRTAEGRSATAIARELGVHEGTVRGVRQRLGLKMPYGHRRHKSLPMNLKVRPGDWDELPEG